MQKKKIIKDYKVWGKKKFMGKEFMGIIRTTFLIDKKGKVIKIWKNVKVKDHAKEVLNFLEGIQNPPHMRITLGRKGGSILVILTN